ncbi:citrate lyase subunit beta/citryl-CoA lyase [Sphingomonas jinjuensis]|uniref:Citrate lyase subunit beta/citryl-CoA lyase n=2 Tax=Sphingomonas jinjuensis TaxID=535907 RepID=A0A840FCI3_9SPHN|nr:citrate lyase subunit beta/citryl-CoA lyase [Sphingomonas jinjuensis]
MPASNPRAVAKARDLACDVVILDLEDAVAPEAKPDARAAAVAAMASGFGDRERVIRINALATEWGAADLDAMRGAAVDAVLLPKVDGPDDLVAARERLGPEGPALWAMVETCAGLVALPAIAVAMRATRTTLLVAGTNDLALDLRARPGADRWPLVPALSQIVAAARAGGGEALDGVLNAIDDPDRLAAECAQGRALGFDGKTLIHPAQIAAANTAFSLQADEIAEAHAIVAAFADPAAANHGAIKVAGRMVERLHLAAAERVLALAPR